MPQHPDCRTGRAAVIEDATERELISAILVEAGYTVSMYEVQDASRVIKEEDFEVVILTNEPAVPARELIDYVYHYKVDLKIIVTSAKPSAAEGLELVRLGAFDYVGKPIAENQLKNIIRRAADLDTYDVSHEEPEMEHQALDTSDDALDPSKPLVLLLGNVDHEGVSSSLRTAGRQYKKKMLLSKPKNWWEIVRYLEDFRVTAVVAKFSPHVYDLFVHNEYAEVSERFVEELSKVPHIVFVFEGLLSGDFSQEYADDFYQPPTIVREAVNAKLRSNRINVLPYRRNAEVTVLAQAFLSDSEHGLLFRVYVPSGRLWANETDRLLQLFRDYLTKVGHSAVRLDQIRTERGIIYELHGGDLAKEGGLSGEFQEFSQLLDLSVTDPGQAEALLRSKNIDTRDIYDILTRYSKEVKRLQVDLRHDRERKLLNIRQRLESELVDILPATVPWVEIERLAEYAVPAAESLASAIHGGEHVPLLAGLSTGSVTINVNSRVVQAVNSVVAEEIQGAVHFTQQDQELLALIRQHGADQIGELVSAVHELADASAPRPGRLLAKQKLKTFLYYVGSKVSDIGTGVLQSYIEKKLLGL